MASCLILEAVEAVEGMVGFCVWDGGYTTGERHKFNTLWSLSRFHLTVHFHYQQSFHLTLAQLQHLTPPPGWSSFRGAQ